MALTKDFTILNPTIICTEPVKIYDKTVDNTTGYWYGWFTVYELVVWTASAAPSTHINLANASTKFAVGEQVTLQASGSPDLPLGLLGYWQTIYYVVTATSTYLELSLTAGGAAVQYTDAGSGTFYINHAGGDLNNPNPVINVAPVTTAASYTVLLTTWDYDSAEADIAHTGALYVLPTTSVAAKPTPADIHHRISIFVYDDDNATVINRGRTANNHLFFKDLKVTGSMNKVGKASFVVFDIGDASATEKGLLVADKNVVILAGTDIIWSGKIQRATQGKMSLFDTAAPFRSYTVECESDITKMVKQSVKSTSKGDYIATVGQIVSTLVVNDAATDINWNGVTEYGVISYEGPKVSYTITDADMYSQFMSLANLSGFDWRTRNNYVKYAYGASGYNSTTKVVTVTAITPYAVDELIGRWLLFIDKTRTDGVVSYGKVTDNDATTITMATVVNPTLPPASSQSVILIGKPVLDFTYDLQTPDAVTTFTANKTRAAALYNCYEVNDKSDFKVLSTKVSMRGKDRFLNTNLVVNQAAITKWNSTSNFFDHATYITHKTEGWVKTGTTTASDIYLYGWDYVLQVDDNVDICYYDTAGTLTVESFHIHAAAEEKADDGTKLTKLTLNVALTHTYPVGTFLTCRKLYVKHYDNVYIGGLNQFGSELITARAGNVDSVYGYYIATNGIADRGESSTTVYPHYTGCLITNSADYSEAAPETDSPVDMFGIILNTQTVDSQATMSDLDVYAANHLINKSYYYRKATMGAYIFDWAKTNLRPSSQVTEAGWIKEGDKIVVLQNTADTATDVEYNQYKNQWQVVTWELDGNTMRVKTELGDFEKNVFLLMNDKTSGLNYTIT